MSDTPEYILRRPVDASYYEEGLTAVEFEDISECLIITDEQFENTFQPLDIPSIEKQLEEILQSTAHTYSEFRARWFAETDAQFRKANTNAFKAERDAIFEAGTNLLLALFGLENTESEK